MPPCKDVLLFKQDYTWCNFSHKTWAHFVWIYWVLTFPRQSSAVGWNEWSNELAAFQFCQWVAFHNVCTECDAVGIFQRVTLIVFHSQHNIKFLSVINQDLKRKLPVLIRDQIWIYFSFIPSSQVFEKGKRAWISQPQENNISLKYDFQQHTHLILCDDHVVWLNYGRNFWR